jgi:hypothetical protein
MGCGRHQRQLPLQQQAATARVGARLLQLRAAVTLPRSSMLLLAAVTLLPLCQLRHLLRLCHFLQLRHLPLLRLPQLACSSRQSLSTKRPAA